MGFGFRFRHVLALAILAGISGCVFSGGENSLGDEKDIVRWACTSFENNCRKNLQYMTEGKLSHAAVNQLRYPAEVKQFLRTASPHEDLNCDEV